MTWQPGDALPRYHYRLGPTVKDPEGNEVHYASFEEVPQCSAQGSTGQEAVMRLWEILPGYLENLVSLGLDVPAGNGQGAVLIGGVGLEGSFHNMRSALAPESKAPPAEPGDPSAEFDDMERTPTESNGVLVA